MMEDCLPVEWEGIQPWHTRPVVSHRHKYDISNQRFPTVPADEVTTVPILYMYCNLKAIV